MPVDQSVLRTVGVGDKTAPSKLLPFTGLNEKLKQTTPVLSSFVCTLEDLRPLTSKTREG
jgi:hypothetical protein